MAYIILPILGILVSLLFTRIGIRILLAVGLLISAVIVFWLGSWTFFAFFMPNHFAHIREVMDAAGNDPNLMLKNVFDNYFPWQY